MHVTDYKSFFFFFFLFIIIQNQYCKYIILLFRFNEKEFFNDEEKFLVKFQLFFSLSLSLSLNYWISPGTR